MFVVGYRFLNELYYFTNYQCNKNIKVYSIEKENNNKLYSNNIYIDTFEDNETKAFIFVLIVR